MLRGTPDEEPLATVHIHGATGDGAIAAGVVAAGARALGLDPDAADQLAAVTRAAARAIYARGFDDPNEATVDVSVLRAGHDVVVRIDDQGLPFDYDEVAADADGAVLTRAVVQGQVDRVHHEWRGREGNRTVLVRGLDPGEDLRDTADPAEHEAAQQAPPAADDVPHTTRLGVPEDAPAIARLTWRTYGPSYQHDEYYQPERLASMLRSGQQVSIVTETADGEVIGHSAMLFEHPGAVVCEAGRAMVDPRYRGHHLMRAPAPVRTQVLAERGILAMLGAAVTAHTRSQRDGPVTSVELAFLPAITFRGIDGTESAVREAVVGGFIPLAEIPPASVVLPERDAAVIEGLYALHGLDRTVQVGAAEAVPSGPTTLDVDVHADLGHAVLDIESIGADLPDVVRSRLRAVLDGGIGVVYADLPLDDPAVSWAADRVAEQGFVFCGIVPLAHAGVDVVRYQRLGDVPVDRAAIQLRSPQAAALLDYVLAQVEAIR